MKYLLFIQYNLFYLLLASLPSTAQIVPDNTLPTNSQINTQGNLSVIEKGTRAGNNLFHSFQEFSIPTGNEAFFNNLAVIKNIFSRVTGGNISNIDGLIRANGSANLFFMNPNGIVFGENARIDIGGSFIATTADEIKFGDGQVFSARDTKKPSVVLNVPIGLGLNGNNGSISVRGTGNNLSIPIPEFDIVRDNRPTGIEVKPGQTMSLLGGEIILEGGNLTAPEGRIELGSVEKGEVGLTSAPEGWKFNYDGVTNFGDINLTQAASVDTTGNSGGAIQVRGRQINVNDGSAIVSNTFDGNGKGVTIESDSLQMSGVTSDNFVSVIASDNINGTGGDLNIKTNQLYMADGSQIRAIVFGEGTTGEVNISTKDLEVTGINPLDSRYLTSIETSVAGESIGGIGKDVNINTQNLLVSGGGRILTDVFGFGRAGNLIINAENIELIEFDNRDIAFLTGLSTSTRQESKVGDTGNIIITTDFLKLIDGAKIRTTASSVDNGGNIVISAKEIEVVGLNKVQPSDFNESSRIITLTRGTGDAGNINIDTNNLQMADGAQISARSLSQGNAGDINVNAENIKVLGFGKILPDLATRITTSTLDIGNAGNINIDTTNLQIIDGGVITADTESIGNAGNISINAEKIELRGSNPLNSNFLEKGGISNSVSFNSTGNGGKIKIETGSLQITGGSQIRSTTFSDGNAGNIDINAKNIEIIGVNSLDTGRLSSILSKTDGNGNGGDMNIKTNSLQIVDGAEINANTNRNSGNAGNIDITSKSIELTSINPFRPDLPSIISTSTNNGSGLGGEININTNSLRITDGAQIRASTVGSDAGDAGSINITAKDIQINGINPFVADDNDLIDSAIFSNIVAFSISPGDAGKIKINTENLRLAEGGRVEAIAFSSGDAGEINLDVKNLSIDSDGIISTSSLDSGNAGTININGETVNINSGSISASSELTGGGQIDINAENLFLNNQAEISTDVFNSTDAGGNITFNTNNIQLNNNTNITASAQGEGRGGNININTKDLIANNQNEITAQSASGQGGNITLNAERIQLKNNSNISASAGGEGDGGNVTITANTVLALNSDVTATANQGNGGNIRIDADGVVGIQEREAIPNNGTSDADASSEFGQDGNVTITSPQSNILDPVLAFREPEFSILEPEFQENCFEQKKRLIDSRRDNIPNKPNESSNSYQYTPDPNFVPPQEPSEFNPKSLEDLIWREGYPVASGNQIITTPDGQVLLVVKSQLESLRKKGCLSEEITVIEESIAPNPNSQSD